MHPHEIVVREVQGDRRTQVFNFPTECIREPREPAHGHPHGQVLALNQTGRNLPNRGVASHDGPMG